MREVRVEVPAAARKISNVVRGIISFPHPSAVQIPVQNTPKGLPKRVPSLCPVCHNHVAATLYEEDGRVFMRKRCPEHGEFKDLFYSHAEMYLKMEKWSFADMKGIDNPMTRNRSCPESCGLCAQHISTACMTIIDLTNRCNLTCPFCFANANASGYEYTVTREQITRMLTNIRAVKPQRCKTVQYSGGEPTIHPDFLWAVREAKRIGIPYVIAATNGITIARSLEFTEQARAAGLDAVYLQFDGTSDSVYEQTRGARLWDLKRKCLENCKKAGVRVVLVPTIARGVNDDQVGNIVQMGLDYLDVVNGISFQPVAFTGRISLDERMKQRYTQSDIAYDIAEQTGLTEPMRDWYPLSFVSPLSLLMEALSGKDIMTISCHSDCGIGAYLIINEEGKAYPVSSFIDLESAMAELNNIAGKLRSFLQKPLYFAQAIRIMKKYYKPDQAPPGFTFGDFMGALGPTLIRSRSNLGKRRKWRFLILLSMHFQDFYNYNIDRVKRCVIHYAAPDGRIYPFCSYNSGPEYRKQIERGFSKPVRKKNDK
jgi:uncharacterized radical SAM superfamily Fe-S cluster-containing enzyme